MQRNENGHPTISEEPTDEMVLAGAKAAADQHYYKANVWEREGYLDDETKRDFLNGTRHAWRAMEAIRREALPDAKT